jgi:DNA modification methylase
MGGRGARGAGARVDAFEHGEVRYCDCLDEERGLPSLGAGAFDLCLTDPPYNLGYRVPDYILETQPHKRALVEYDDEIGDYEAFSGAWFRAARRAAARLIFTCGNRPRNLAMWFRIEEPVDVFIHYKPDCQSRSSMCVRNRYDPILLYGGFAHRLDFPTNVFEVPMWKEAARRDYTLIHPSPKSYELYLRIVERCVKKFGIRSVVDPFLGSGTTAEVCEALGLEWLGYEVDEVYSEDIGKRLASVTRPSRQRKMEEFMSGG